MQQALENPHFKKIWEEVNWKIRHPKAKSLEEALFLETHNADCNVLHCGLNLIVFMQSLCLLRNSGFNLGNKAYHSFSQSFGRPITLDDILLIFVEKTSDKLQGFSAKHVRFYAIDFVGDWQLTKPLHEQSPETWEKISKLINK